MRKSTVGKVRENILEGGKSVVGVKREKEQARIGIGGGQKKTPFRWKLEGKEKEKLGWAP